MEKCDRRGLLQPPSTGNPLLLGKPNKELQLHSYPWEAEVSGCCPKCTYYPFTVQHQACGPQMKMIWHHYVQKPLETKIIDQ